MSAWLAAGPVPARVLADGGGDLGAGFIAFIVVLVLCVACYFLFRSMAGHLKKVPASFDPPKPPPDDET